MLDMITTIKFLICSSHFLEFFFFEKSLSCDLKIILFKFSLSVFYLLEIVIELPDHVG